MPHCWKSHVAAHIVLYIKHACELIFLPRIVVNCIYTQSDVLTILLFHTQHKEEFVRSKAAFLLLLIEPRHVISNNVVF